MRWAVEAKANTAFAMALALLLLIAAASYASITRLSESAGQVSHTHDVLARLEGLRSAAVDVESGMRGFAVTGDDTYLEPYLSGRLRLAEEVQALRRLTSDNRAQQDALERLGRQADAYVAWAAEVVRVRRERGGAAAVEHIRAGEGKRQMDNLRALVAAMKGLGAELLVSRLREAASTRRFAIGVILVGAALAVGLVTTASMAIHREIARRERAETVRYAAEARYRRLFESDLIGVFRTLREGRVLDCNEAFARILGFASRGEALEASAVSFYVNPADRERLLSDVNPGAPLGGVEVEMRRADGQRIWVLLHALEFLEGGEGRIEGMIVDITDRKQADESVRSLNQALEAQVARLDAVNQELDAFTYSVSHDLRAPLRAMQGFAQALIEDYGDRFDDVGHGYAKRIVAASQLMDGLIQDLLVYSRLTRAELTLKAVDLETLVDDVLAGIASELKERRAEVAVVRPLPAVLAHAGTLTQILVNLLSNALKFVPAGQIPMLSVRAERRGPSVRLWVQDNGIGIAPEHQERIFLPFERLHGREHYPGTGIGLAIVRAGAERLGGRAGVESIPGHGSQFWVDLKEAAPVA